MAASDDAAQSLVAQRDLNCLADDNRQTRKRALTKLGALPSAGHAPEVLAPVWSELLRTPITKLFADPVEKNRELAITLTSDLFAVVPDATIVESLALVVPAAVARVGGSVVAEESEENGENDQSLANPTPLMKEMMKKRRSVAPKTAASNSPGGGSLGQLEGWTGYHSLLSAL